MQPEFNFARYDVVEKVYQISFCCVNIKNKRFEMIPPQAQSNWEPMQWLQKRSRIQAEMLGKGANVGLA